MPLGGPWARRTWEPGSGTREWVTAACSPVPGVPWDESLGMTVTFASTEQAGEELTRDWGWTCAPRSNWPEDDELLCPTCAKEAVGGARRRTRNIRLRRQRPGTQPERAPAVPAPTAEAAVTADNPGAGRHRPRRADRLSALQVHRQARRMPLPRLRAVPLLQPARQQRLRVLPCRAPRPHLRPPPVRLVIKADK